MKLYERMNDRLTIENNRLYEMLREDRIKYDDLKMKFDSYLNLNVEDKNEDGSPEAFGGYTNRSKLGRRLQVASFRRAQEDAERIGRSVEKGSEAERTNGG